MKYVLMLAIVLAIACGGGDGGTFSQRGAYIPPQQEVPVGYTPAYSGITTQTSFDQKTVITTAEDFDFYLRLFTGSSTVLAESIISLNDVLMIVHPITESQFFYTIDSITTDDIGQNITIYFYYTASDKSNHSDIGKRRYQFYYIPDETGIITWVELNK